MATFRSASKSCPIQVGQVLRVMREQAGIEKVAIAPWWPVPDPEKYGQKVKWQACKWDEKGKTTMMIPLADLLVWPVNMETNDAGDPIRIPFTAFHYLRSRHGMDFSHHHEGRQVLQ